MGDGVTVAQSTHYNEAAALNDCACHLPHGIGGVGATGTADLLGRKAILDRKGFALQCQQGDFRVFHCLGCDDCFLQLYSLLFQTDVDVVDLAGFDDDLRHGLFRVRYVAELDDIDARLHVKGVAAVKIGDGSPLGRPLF